MKTVIKFIMLFVALVGYACVGGKAMVNVMSLPDVLVFTAIMTFVGVVTTGVGVVLGLAWVLFENITKEANAEVNQ